MATLAEIRFDILRKVKGQILSDDERLDDAYIDKLIRDKRNFLIRDEMKRGLGFHQAYLQVVDCVSVECGSVSCAGIPSGVTYHYAKMPAGVTGRINFLGSTDNSITFQECSVSAFIYAMPGRFGKSIPRYTIIDGMALLKYHPSNLNILRLIAALDDPMEKYGPVADVCLLDHENDQYPVPVEQISRLQNLVLMDLLPTRNIQPDTTNNAADETTPADINAKAMQSAQSQE